MRRRYGRTSLSAVLLLIGWSLAGGARAQSPSRDVLQEVAVHPSLIVYNAKIYTMDSGLSSHQAMAIRGDRIWKLGTNRAIRRLAGPQTESIDAKGRPVLPGIIDTHNHPHLGAATTLGWKYDPQLKFLFPAANTAEEYKTSLARGVRERIQQAGADKWVMAGVPPDAQRAVFSPQGGVTRDDLDRIAPNTPLAITGGIVGGLVYNTKAKDAMLQVLGKEVPNSAYFFYLVVYDLILKNRTAEAAKMLSEEMEQWVALGITSMVSHVESPQVLRSLNHLDQQGKMPFRWAWIHRLGFALAKDPTDFYSLLGDSLGQGSAFLWNIGLSEDNFDAEYCTSAIPRPQYRDQMNRTCRVNQLQGTRIFDGFSGAARAGLRIAGGITGSDRGLDALFQLADQIVRDKVMTLEELRKMGWEFDYARMVRPDQVPLLAKYGFWVSFAPSVLQSEEQTLQNFGPEYLPWVSPIKALSDASGRVVFGTGGFKVPRGTSEEELLADDWLNRGNAVFRAYTDEWRNTIWPQMEPFVTREINGKVYSPEKRLDRTKVLQGWTSKAAELALRAKDLGSLEPGKLADFIMIDKDYFTIPEKEIHTIQTLMTVIGGKTRFRSSRF